MAVVHCPASCISSLQTSFSLSLIVQLVTFYCNAVNISRQLLEQDRNIGEDGKLEG